MAAERSENNGLSGNAAAQHGLSSARGQKLLARVQGLYEKNFQRLPEGKAYLRRCGIVDPGLWSRHRIGYCNGAIPALLPPAGEAVDGLKALGVLTDRGEECLRGCVTFPIVDSAGAVCAIWGRRIIGEDAADLHLPPGNPGGEWKGGGSGPVLFVTQSILDGLSLGQAGFESVIALVGGWTAEHEIFLREHKPEEVFLCLGSDPGERETEQHLREGVLPALGIAVQTVCWPEGIDTVDFYLSRSRRALIGEAALLFGVTAEVIETDIRRLIIRMENHLRQTQVKGTAEDQTRAILQAQRQSHTLEGLRRHLPGHTAESVPLIGWGGLNSAQSPSPFRVFSPVQGARLRCPGFSITGKMRSSCLWKCRHLTCGRS